MCVLGISIRASSVIVFCRVQSGSMDIGLLHASSAILSDRTVFIRLVYRISQAPAALDTHCAPVNILCSGEGIGRRLGGAFSRTAPAKLNYLWRDLTSAKAVESFVMASKMVPGGVINAAAVQYIMQTPGGETKGVIVQPPDQRHQTPASQSSTKKMITAASVVLLVVLRLV
jgi:hypothetical protein